MDRLDRPEPEPVTGPITVTGSGSTDRAMDLSVRTVSSPVGVAFELARKGFIPARYLTVSQETQFAFVTRLSPADTARATPLRIAAPENTRRVVSSSDNNTTPATAANTGTAS